MRAVRMRLLAFSLTAVLAVLALAPGAAPAGAGKLHLEDLVFLLYAVELDRTQARLGQLAADRAQDEQVREFARRMIDYHEQSSGRLTQVAQRYGIEPPQEVSPVAKRIHDRLQRLAGIQFDDEYIAGQVIQHYSAHYFYKREKLHGQDEQLRREAGQQAENLKEHRHAAQQIARRLNARPAGLHVEDRSFLLYAMDVDFTQLQLSQLAADKARDERVRNFAQRMLDYHKASYGRLARIAQENGIEPLQEIGPIARMMHEQLRQLTGRLFDWQYINAQVIYHYAAFYRYERESLHGRDKQVRGFGAEAFRDIKEHHDAAQKIVRDWNR
jgi:putative membrane protein